MSKEKLEILCDDILARLLDNDTINVWDDADLVKRLQEVRNA